MAQEDRLEAQLIDVRRNISSDSYPMSLGELTNLYRDGELIIRPPFQRLFRWDDRQKSALIESILLGIPIPSIFVAQDRDGKWELVDGLQRVSTILQLQGVLEGAEPLVLTAAPYLTELEGLAWAGGEGRSLTDAQKLDFKRAKIDVKIIKRESGDRSKYDLFQRLNSFGSTLTPQEIRNAVLVSINGEFASWLMKLASRDSFQATTRLPDNSLATKYDEELVLRFLWLHQQDELRVATTRFQEGLEQASIQMAQDHDRDRDRLETTFNSTFDLLQERLGENAFRRWMPAKGRFQGGFLNTAYEVIGMGLGYRIANGLPVRGDIDQAPIELWGQPEMTAKFATGKSTERRLEAMIPKGRSLMGPASSWL